MTLLRLASASEGRAVLEAEDDFTRALGRFDRSFRMRSVETVDDAALRRYLAEQALDFAKEEEVAWEEAIATVARGMRGLGGVLPPEVLVVKTTGHEERGHAYTRGTAIVLPAERVRSWRGERAYRLLAHELFHVASRTSPVLRDELYALLGFRPIGPITPPAELDDKRLTNPDTPTLGHYLMLGERAVMPLLICPSQLADVLDRTSVLGVMQTMLLQIDPAAGAPLRDSSGAPILIEPDTTDWAKRLARNTTYTIHPEEVLADNLSLFVRRRLGVDATPADADFFAMFEAALTRS